MCNEDFSPHYKGNMKRPFDFSFFFQVHHEYLNSQASVSIELQRLFVFASFSIISTANKREILNKLLWLRLPRENLCALQGMNKQNMNIQDEAASDLPYAIHTGDNATLPSRAWQKGVFIKPIPFRNDHFEWRKNTSSILTFDTCN